MEAARFLAIAVIVSAHLEARNLVVRGTRPRASDLAFGRALDIEAGGTAEVRRAFFERNRSDAVFVSETTGSLVIEDSAVIGTLPQESDADFGHGLAVMLGASAEARRVVIEDNIGVGVAAMFEGSRLLIEDSVMRGTAVYESDGQSGFGLSTQDQATIEARRVLLEGNAESDVFAQRASLSLEDSVIRNTAGRPDGAYGRGIQVQLDSTVTISRALVERSRQVGVQLNDRSVVTAEDLAVRDTLSDRATLQSARGVGVESGSTVDLNRVAITRVRELGVSAFGADSTVRMRDAAVRGVESAECAATTCPDSPFGTALGAFGAAVDLASFRIEDAALCGVQLTDGASLDLADGEVTSATLGACVQVDGYDVSRLTRNVRYLDNGVNLETTTLPIPDGLPTAGR